MGKQKYFQEFERSFSQEEISLALTDQLNEAYNPSFIKVEEVSNTVSSIIDKDKPLNSQIKDIESKVGSFYGHVQLDLKRVKPLIEFGLN